MITVQDLSFQYPSGAGFTNVSFSASGLTGLVGRNGAGKSTLFHCLAGLRPAQNGNVSFNNQAIDYETFAIGYLPEADYFLPKLSGKQNLEYQSYLKTKDLAAWKQQIDLLNALELSAALAKPFGEYSTGMRKKIQLVASLIGDPSLLIWDEPHNGVDLLSNIVINQVLQTLVAAGKTILLSSHVAEILLGLSDQIHVLKDGRLSQSLTKPFPSDLAALL
jgi:ABC-2 type transport system ATP-binding protein